MFRNLADALHDLAVSGYDLRQLKSTIASSKNSAQAQGDFLEIVIKDILCGVAVLFLSSAGQQIWHAYTI